MKQIKVWVKEIHYQMYEMNEDVQDLCDAIQAVKQSDESKFIHVELDYSHTEDESEWIITEETDGLETGRFKVMNGKITKTAIQ